MYKSNFQKAVTTVFAGKYPELENHLKLNVSKFAAYKAFHLTENLKNIDSKDKNELKQKATLVIKKFNNWAATENNTITSRSRTAKQFKQFEADKDILPNLKWISSRSVNKREQHVLIAGTILPINDPFWNSHQPGNLWNCKCDWVQTDEPVNKPTNVNVKAAKGLEGNPAETGEVFTKEHPYFTKAKGNKDVEKFIEEKSSEMKKIQRKEIKDWADKNLLDKKVSLIIEDKNKEITFTTTGIKETINQPHKFYIEKNIAIYNIIEHIKNGEFIKSSEDKKRGCIFYYYKLKIKNEDSFIVLKETSNNKNISLYSIVDKLKE